MFYVKQNKRFLYMRLFNENIVKYNMKAKKGYYWRKIKLPNKIGEWLWNKDWKVFCND